MKEEFISEIQRKMLPYLNNEQLLQLRYVLTKHFEVQPLAMKHPRTSQTNQMWSKRLSQQSE